MKVPARAPRTRARASFWDLLPWLALAAALAVAASGFGARFGAWTWQAGFGILRYASYAALAVLAVAVAALLLPRARAERAGRLFLALVVAGAAGAVPLYWMWQARTLPAINDISTDLANPPRFDKIVPLRERAPVSVRHPGLETARLQRAAYPDIRTRVLRQPVGRTFEQALAVARDMGWTIVAADRASGFIEATATTFWFGFKDDVAIRIVRTGDDMSRVDVRSVSRVGKSDLGANARRVRAFLARLKG